MHQGRARISAVCILLSGAACAALFCSGRPVLNTTASVPVGLWLRIDTPPQRGSVVRVPVSAFTSTAWIPEVYWRKNAWGEPRDFLKRVAGLPGERVESGPFGLIQVAGQLILNSAPLSEDRAGRYLRAFPLPHILASDEVWLLSDSPRGFDSRYLGPAKIRRCRTVVPLLTF